MKHDLVIIGAGPAGLAAAIAAYDMGVRDILVLERDRKAGGILEQCIHNGFGLKRFGEELTGPEYAYRYIQMAEERGITVLCNTMVLSLSADRIVTATSPERGIFHLQAKAVILAMGCRERPRGALNIPGTRPAGIYSAGTAQKFVNLMGILPGRDVVILGSGDIGLIMARRMTLEGARVHAVCELAPYSGGLARNIEQCLNDFDIPLYLSHTVTAIHGKERLEGVTVSAVDREGKPIEGTSFEIRCDTLLLSVGLIPENELSEGAGIDMDQISRGAVVDQDRMTSIEGVYACGNVLHVHDLVDYVSEEAARAGEAAAKRILEMNSKGEVTSIRIKPAFGVRYCVPQILNRVEKTDVYFRVTDVYRGVRIVVKEGEQVLLRLKRRSVAPGEMERITLPESIMSGKNHGELTVSIELEEEKA